MEIDQLSIGVAVTEQGATVVVCSKNDVTGVVTIIACEEIALYRDKYINLDLKGVLK